MCSLDAGGWALFAGGAGSVGGDTLCAVLYAGAVESGLRFGVSKFLPLQFSRHSPPHKYVAVLFALSATPSQPSHRVRSFQSLLFPLDLTATAKACCRLQCVRFIRSYVACLPKIESVTVIRRFAIAPPNLAAILKTLPPVDLSSRSPAPYGPSGNPNPTRLYCGRYRSYARAGRSGMAGRSWMRGRSCVSGRSWIDVGQG